MKTQLHRLLAALYLFTLLLSSCKTSNDVMSDRLIQKRKYNNGFFVEKKSGPTEKTTTVVQKENALTNEVAPITKTDSKPTTEEPKPAALPADVVVAEKKDAKTESKPALLPKIKLKMKEDEDSKWTASVWNAVVAPSSPDAAEQTTGEGGGLSIASLIISIVGWIVPWQIGIVLLGLALILGVLGLKKNVRRGAAIAGIVISLVGLIFVMIAMSMGIV
ncbi:MAG: DUF4190 domain-containing protein [Flavobacteriales bacterium]